jgi:hypothetical protein
MKHDCAEAAEARRRSILAEAERRRRIPFNPTWMSPARVRELNALSEWNRDRQAPHAPKVDPDRAH